MYWFVLIAVLVWFILFLRKKLSFKFGLSPIALEIKPIKGLKKLTDHLEQSLDNTFMEYVEERVREKIRLKENEYEWRLLDLKRYFIVTTVLKDAPMFSYKVDELWHEMLMFTREYENFSQKYLGSTLHHKPNITAKYDPDLRGFFDWIYAELFFVRKENIELYKGFFKYPIHPSIIDEFRNLPEDKLIDRYFNKDLKYKNTVLSLISAMKKSARSVKKHDKHMIREMLRKRKLKQNFNGMLFPFISVSYFHYDEFSSYMKVGSDSYMSSNSNSASYCSSGSSCSSCSSCSGGGD